MITIRVEFTEEEFNALHKLATQDKQYTMKALYIHESNPLIAVFRALSAHDLVNMDVDRRDPESPDKNEFIFRVWLTKAGLWLYQSAGVTPIELA